MILFENVTKQYRGTQRPALDRVSFEIERGEFVFVVGASGSGKSSCLRLILREEQPTGGKIHVLGHDLGKISSRKVPYFRRNLGVVFQDFRLLANKTVYDNVAFSLQVIGKSRGFIQEAVPDTLKMVGLEGKEKRYPHELSGGEQQRVAIARAIVNKPSMLLADEPTGNLDPATSLGIMQLLRAINAAGTTVVMATHEAAFVDVMKQRVIEISQGVIVRDEKHGGYGETAAIMLEDLSQAGVRTMRTSDDQVRSVLSPETPVGEPTLVTAGPAMPVIPAAPAVPVPPVPPVLADPAAAPAVPPAQPTAAETPDAVAGSVQAEPSPITHTGLNAATAAPAESAAAVAPAAEPVAAEPAAPPAAPTVPEAPKAHPAVTAAVPQQAERDIPEFLRPAPRQDAPAPQAPAVVPPPPVAVPLTDPPAPTALAVVPGVPVAPVTPAAYDIPTPEDDAFDKTVTAAEFARVNRVDPPHSEDERDPIRLAQQGGWAKRLGLDTGKNDDQTDVGPVR